MSKELRLPCDVGEVSDGFHTFSELYDHRQTLFLCLMNMLEVQHIGLPWKSWLHTDGTMFEGPENWFIAGVELPGIGKTITYHLEGRFWEKLRIKELDRAPHWDGHSPQDVVRRLLEWA